MESFDDRHFHLKLRPAVKRLHKEAGKCWAGARAEVKVHGNEARLFPAFIDSHMEALRKYLEEVDRVCREVRVMDGNAVTPEFIRNILLRRVSEVIAARKGAIGHEVDLHAMRTGEHKQGARHHLAFEMSRLLEDMANHYEVEAIEIHKRRADGLAVSGVPASTAAVSPRKPVNSPAPKLAKIAKPQSRSSRRAKAVAKLLRELRMVKPRMHNEGQYVRVEREFPNYLIFRIAQRDSEVRPWIESVQDRRGLVGLAQEIAARHFNVSLTTVKTDWSHRGKPRRCAKTRR